LYATPKVRFVKGSALFLRKFVFGEGGQRRREAGRGEERFSF